MRAFLLFSLNLLPGIAETEKEIFEPERNRNPGTRDIV
jgi:hypothetical protein